MKFRYYNFSQQAVGFRAVKYTTSSYVALQAFADRYCQCNVEAVQQFHRPDTVFLLAFATIMLNTDLHNKNIKADRKMKLTDFIHNLRGMTHRLSQST